MVLTKNISYAKAEAIMWQNLQEYVLLLHEKWS